MIKKLLFVISLCMGFLQYTAVVAFEPVSIDSRIKTFVYSPNEVFRIMVSYGYQTNIEFAEGEEIQTISVGNNYVWQITPVGRRLFIKPLEESINTNMTIITNRRSYQFEIISRPSDYINDEDLVFVIRFFYPDQNYDVNPPKVEMSNSVQEAGYRARISPYNFNYTLSGPEDVAPKKVFDDGVNTLFKFADKNNLPELYFCESGNDCKEEDMKPLHYRIRGDYLVVNLVANKFMVKGVDGKVVMIFNENNKEN